MRENPSSAAMKGFLRPLMPTLDTRGGGDWQVLAEAALARGFSVIELLKRSDHALRDLARIKRQYPQLSVGMGTILSVRDGQLALEAGADFLVSPGTTPALLEAFAGASTPYLPGVATPSEMMLAAEAGYLLQKIFPAAALGAHFIRSLKGPFPALGFVLSGGIDAENQAQFAELPLVRSLSGSWLLPS